MIQQAHFWVAKRTEPRISMKYPYSYVHACMSIHRFSRVQLFATLGTVARQTPLSMGFSRQEYWSGLPRPFPGDLPDPGMKPASLTSPAFYQFSSVQSLSRVHSLNRVSHKLTCLPRPGRDREWLKQARWGW